MRVWERDTRHGSRSLPKLAPKQAHEYKWMTTVYVAACLHKPKSVRRHANVRTRTHPCRTHARTRNAKSVDEMPLVRLHQPPGLPTPQARAHDTQPRMLSTHAIPTFGGCTGTARILHNQQGSDRGAQYDASNEDTSAGCAPCCRVVQILLRRGGGCTAAHADAKAGGQRMAHTEEAAHTQRERAPRLERREVPLAGVVTSSAGVVSTSAALRAAASAGEARAQAGGTVSRLRRERDAARGGPHHAHSRALDAARDARPFRTARCALTHCLSMQKIEWFERKSTPQF